MPEIPTSALASSSEHGFIAKIARKSSEIGSSAAEEKPHSNTPAASAFCSPYWIAPVPHRSQYTAVIKSVPGNKIGNYVLAKGRLANIPGLSSLIYEYEMWTGSQYMATWIDNLVAD
jgi:hypothetical protein